MIPPGLARLCGAQQQWEKATAELIVWWMVDGLAHEFKPFLTVSERREETMISHVGGNAIPAADPPTTQQVCQARNNNCCSS